MLLVWALILGLVLAIGWLLTHPAGDGIDAFDDALARRIADKRTPTLDRIAGIAAVPGDTMVSLVIAPVVAVGMWVWQRSPVPAAFVALVVLGVGGFYRIVTELEPRQRPPVEILDAGLVPTHSFPSGHVGTATALYGLLIALAWTYLRAARRWAALLAVLPVVVLLARVYQGAHHLSDVLTSLAYATGWLGALWLLLLRPGADRDSATAHHRAT